MSGSDAPLPEDNDKGDTTKIVWTLDNISIIAERNELGRWDVYAKENDIIISSVTQNIASNSLLYIVKEYKDKYYSNYEVEPKGQF